MKRFIIILIITLLTANLIVSLWNTVKWDIIDAYAQEIVSFEDLDELYNYLAEKDYTTESIEPRLNTQEFFCLDLNGIVMVTEIVPGQMVVELVTANVEFYWTTENGIEATWIDGVELLTEPSWQQVETFIQQYAAADIEAAYWMVTELDSTEQGWDYNDVIYIHDLGLDVRVTVHQPGRLVVENIHTGLEFVWWLGDDLTAIWKHDQLFTPATAFERDNL